MTTLLAVPNVSEGRDHASIGAIGEAFANGGARLLDVHRDADHHRSVFTLAAPPGRLAAAVAAGAAAALERIDLSDHTGVHPNVGAVDVAPVVYLDEEQRGAACAEALVVADELGRNLELPVFLYGLLAGGRTRADLRRGGLAELTRRMESRELAPDFGPPVPDPRRGVTLVAARPPLVAFNVELAAGAALEQAQAIAAAVRSELAGVRALGLPLASRDAVQVSFNVENPLEVPLAAVVDAVRSRAPVAGAELVGLAPEAAFAGFPDDVPIRGFDPARHLVEGALASG